MPFSATVNLGTVGVAITSVKLYGCTGNSGTDCTGCTALTGYENVSVSTFPLLVSGIPTGVRYIQAEALGACSADAVKQCISISGIPGPTATPVPTMTPTPSATTNGATPNPTSTQTPTPTPSGTSDISPTMTPTPTMTSGGGNCTITGQNSVSPGSPTQTGQIILQTTGRVMNLSVFGGASSGGSSSLTLTVVGSSFTPTPNPSSVTITANQGQTSTGTLTLPNTGTYNYTLTISTVGTSGHNGSFTCGDSYVGPTPTPSPSATGLPGCSSTVTGEYTGSTMYNYPDRQLDFTGTPNGSVINFTCTANDRPNNISIRTDLGVLDSTGWFGNSSGYDSQDYWYPTEGTGPITLSITYDNTKTYYIDALTAPALAAPNDINDNWEVSIQCLGVLSTPTPTPTVTTEELNVFYIASSVDSSLTGSTYCSSPGYIMSGVVKSTSTDISGMLGKPIYDSNGDPFTGPGSGYVYAIKTTQYGNTYDDGRFDWIEIDSMGIVTDVGGQSCGGGGGPL